MTKLPPDSLTTDHDHRDSPPSLLTDRAYEHLRRRILLSEIGPNAVIDEKAVAEELGMSRTPVREALLRLRSDGIVEISRQTGVRVIPLTRDDLREIYEVLTGLETIAAGRLAQRKPAASEVPTLVRAVADMGTAHRRRDVIAWGEADERFHRQMLELCGNRRLREIGLRLRDQALRAHLLLVRLQTRQYRGQSMQAHAKLLAAILAGDVDAAAENHYAQRTRGESAIVAVLDSYSLTNL